MMNEVRGASGDVLAEIDLPFQDKRLPEMLFRYRARNFPDTLSAEDQGRWQHWCIEQLTDNPNKVGLDAQSYFSRLDELTKEKPERQDLLNQLREYGLQVCGRLGIET